MFKDSIEYKNHSLCNRYWQPLVIASLTNWSISSAAATGVNVMETSFARQTLLFPPDRCKVDKETHKVQISQFWRRNRKEIIFTYKNSSLFEILS